MFHSILLPEKIETIYIAFHYFHIPGVDEDEKVPKRVLEFGASADASWFPLPISCSVNLPRVYIKLVKHGNL